VSESAARTATATPVTTDPRERPAAYPISPPEVLDARFGTPLGTIGSRLVWFVLAALPTTVITTAAMLTPNPLGHGTHTQLGLPPCGFLVVTGYPCPGCGLTTSFANMADGHIVAAAHANAFGILLFLVSAATIPVALAGLVRGWAVVPVLERLHIEKWALVLALVSMTVWVARCLTTFFW
jgi:Protein of unknown function (DUF2752)